MMHVRLTNSMTKEKQPIVPLRGNELSLYVCGITPYDAPILAMAAVSDFDLLYRLLAFLGFDVTYCRNFTDIDDKLLNKSEKSSVRPINFLRSPNTISIFLSTICSYLIAKSPPLSRALLKQFLKLLHLSATY